MHRLISLFTFIFILNTQFANGQDSLIHKPLGKYQALMWEITGPGLQKPSYLYGALETSQKLAYHLIDSFFTGINSTERIVLEQHPDSVRKALKDPAILKRVYKRSLVTSYSPSYDYYEILQPQEFDADMFEYVLAGSRSFLNRGMSSDMEEERSLPDFVYMAALKLGKDIAGVISYSEQLDFSDMAEKVMKDERKKQKNIREDYSEQMVLYQRVLEAYRKGDIGLLDSIYRRLVNSDALYSEVVDSINSLYAARLAEQLNESSLFAVIDALYLAGENGIIEHLRKLGFELRPVNHYILTKPNRQIEKLEKMTTRTKPVAYTSKSGFWDIMVPDYTTGSADERGGRTVFTDQLNNTVYTVNRYPTHAQLSFQSPDYLLQTMDSVIYEYVPGKILKRKDFRIGGYPAVEITNRTSKGDLEMFKLVITPLEVILFRISGPRNNIRKNRIGKKFLGSANINLPEKQTWTTVTTGHGEFLLTLPSYHIVDSVSNLVFVDPEIEYQAWDPDTESYFLFRRNVHHDLNYLEEDTFDLNFMAEQMANEMSREIDLMPPSHINGFPCVNFSMWTKDKTDTLAAKIVIRGASHYLLITNTKEPDLRDRYLNGFSVTPFEYTLKKDTVVDSTFLYTVVSDIYKQELDDDEDDDNYYLWYNEEDDEKDDDSYKSKKQTATYYFDLGSEYIVVEKLKEHDYKQYPSYDDLWTTLIALATNDSDMVIRKIESDSTISFPYLYLVVTDTNTIRQIHKKFIINHGVIYTLSTMSDTVEGLPEYSDLFFRTFSPFEDSVKGRSLFEDNGMLFIRNFISDDTSLVKQAISSLYLVKFNESHRDSLYYLISNADLMIRNMGIASKLIIEYAKLKSEKYRNELELLYPKYKNNPSIQFAIFRGLAHQKHPEARRAMLSIMIDDLPIPHDPESISALLKPLQSSLDQSSVFFPDILQFESYTEYSYLIYALLTELIKQDKFNLDKNLSVTPVLQKRITEELKRRLQTNQIDKAATEPLKDIYVPFYDLDYYPEEEFVYEVDEDFYEIAEWSVLEELIEGEPELRYSELILMIKSLSHSKRHEKWLTSVYDKVLTGRDKNDALALAVFLANKSSYDVADSIWHGFAKDNRIRVDLYRKLLNAESMQYFDSTFLNQRAFTESLLTIKGDLDDKDSLTFLQRRFINTPRSKGYVYFYKYKSGYGNNRNWMIGIVGIQPEDTLRVSAKPDFVNLDAERIYIDDDIDDVISKQMKEMRKLYRKRFNASEYDFYGEEFLFDAWGNIINPFKI